MFFVLSCCIFCMYSAHQTQVPLFFYFIPLASAVDCRLAHVIDVVPWLLMHLLHFVFLPVSFCLLFCLFFSFFAMERRLFLLLGIVIAVMKLMLHIILYFIRYNHIYTYIHSHICFTAYHFCCLVFYSSRCHVTGSLPTLCIVWPCALCTRRTSSLHAIVLTCIFAFTVYLLLFAICIIYFCFCTTVCFACCC